MNHPIVTLHGMGGIGKTSLALFGAHRLAAAKTPHFEFIVWFSARDVDLRPTGPSSVRPSVVDLAAVSKAFASLFGVDPKVESFAKVLQSPKPHSEKGILFIFDNFETIADATSLHKFLDEHTHLPNKVLITSRERAFVADFPIEVRGMERGEAFQMMKSIAQELSIEKLVTEEIMEGIYSYTGGHAYVMRVILGEMAKEQRYTPPKQLIPRRMDIVDAVFERSFNKFSDGGRNVFLTVANWKSEISELALIVVLGQRGLDVEAGIEECKRLSMILPNTLMNHQPCYSAPQLARIFGHKKLQGDADRLVIQEDIETLRRFGVIGKSHLEQQTQDDLILQFVNWCMNEASGKDSATISRLDGMSTHIATQIHTTGEATGFISAAGDKGKPITVIGTNSIRAGFDATCLQQALNARSAPGVTDLVLNPDAHAGYGAPVGCVLTSISRPGRRGHQMLDELPAT